MDAVSRADVVIDNRDWASPNVMRWGTTDNTRPRPEPGEAAAAGASLQRQQRRQVGPDSRLVIIASVPDGWRDRPASRPCPRPVRFSSGTEMPVEVGVERLPADESS